MRALHDIRQAVHAAAFAEADRVGGWEQFRPKAVMKQFAGRGLSRSTVYAWVAETRLIESNLKAEFTELDKLFETFRRDAKVGVQVPFTALPWDRALAFMRGVADLLETLALTAADEEPVS